ncbi:unnamed protein product, partial [Heterotrigona itama]
THLLLQICKKIWNPDIPIKNRYSVFADRVINELDSGSKKTELQNDIPNADTAINLIQTAINLNLLKSPKTSNLRQYTFM